MKINFNVIALTFFVTIIFLSGTDPFSAYEPANAKANIVPGSDVPTTNMTSDDGGVGPSTSSTAGRLNAADIAQTNTLKLDSDVKNLVILIPDARLITQNYLPLDATIVQGTKVIWVNGDKVSPHRISLEDSKMQPIFFNETIPYQYGTEYTFDTQGTYTVSDPLNTDPSAPSGTVNVIAPENAPDNLSTNSTQATAGLFVVQAGDKDYFDKQFNTSGYHVEDSHMIPGPERYDIQLYVYTQKSDEYPTILDRTATMLQFLPFPDLVHRPFIMQNFKGTIKLELFTGGLSHPTSMAFVDNATILVLEKDSGNIRKISDGVLEEDPVLQINVDSTGERGLLGITVLRKEKQEESTAINTNLNNDRKSLETCTEFVANLTSSALSIPSNLSYCNISVFIYFTQKNESITAVQDNSNRNNSPRNVIYEYDWDGKSLINPKLLVDLPVPPYHNGGKLKIGPDNQLYAVIGDLASPNSLLQNSQLTNNNNNNNASLANNSLVIIRIDPDTGFPSKDNPFLKPYLNNSVLQIGSKEGRGGLDYYAYGIRNSFGLAFDPVTEKLWDTENGKDEYDEINIVSPGFNSGWHKIMGPKSESDNIRDSDPVIFKAAHYSDPVFSWKKAIGVTDIEFFNSSKLGNEYTNNLYVGDINNGNLYFFKVNDNRSGLNFEDIPGIANDLIADNKEEVNAVTVGTGFGGITDIETGPDGYLYILTYYDGRIYKITND